MRLTAAVFSALAFLSISAGTVRGNAVGFGDVAISQSNVAFVAKVASGEVADAVVVNAGYDRDFCTGARCSVERESVPVAEIIIVAATRSRAVALITSLENNQTIQTGDTVKLKTI